MQKGITGSHYKFDRKTESVTIRVTPNELKIIRRKASLSGMSVSEYVIDCAIKKRVAGYNPAELSINDIDCDGNTIDKFQANPERRHCYDCNHDCDALYEAYEKGKRDERNRILKAIEGGDEADPDDDPVAIYQMSKDLRTKEDKDV